MHCSCKSISHQFFFFFLSGMRRYELATTHPTVFSPALLLPVSFLTVEKFPQGISTPNASLSLLPCGASQKAHLSKNPQKSSCWTRGSAKYARPRNTFWLKRMSTISEAFSCQFRSCFPLLVLQQRPVRKVQSKLAKHCQSAELRTGCIEWTRRPSNFLL